MLPSEHSSDVKFEIGHVLFIDIVGYSKLLINEQSEQMQKLKEIVRGTEQFRLAEAEGKLLRLPTGDGGALVFRNSPEAPVLCAIEISKALKKSSRASSSHGNSQRSGQRSHRFERTSEHRRRWHQHRAAGDGLRRRRPHSSLQRVADDLEQYRDGIRFCTISANAK